MKTIESHPSSVNKSRLSNRKRSSSIIFLTLIGILARPLAGQTYNSPPGYTYSVTSGGGIVADIDGNNEILASANGIPSTFLSDSWGTSDNQAVVVSFEDGALQSYSHETINSMDGPVGQVDGFSSAYFIYHMEVEGPADTIVPVDLYSSGDITASANIPYFVDALAAINVTGAGVDYYASTPSFPDFDTIDYSSDPTSVSEVENFNTEGQKLNIQAGDIYTIQLTVFTESVGGDLPGYVWTDAVVDPYFEIDRSFADADQYQIVVSNGVINAPPSTVADSSSAVIEILAISGFLLLFWRRNASSVANCSIFRRVLTH